MIIFYFTYNIIKPFFFVKYLNSLKAELLWSVHYAILSGTLLLQLHFNSSPDAHLVPDEVILCIMEKIELYAKWCDFIRDKMSSS